MSCVLITGASSGIGLQLAIDYAASGWQVIACGRDQDKLRRSLQDSKISAFRSFDTADPQACATALAVDAEQVDLAILNAGTCEYMDDVRQFDAAMFARVISTNVLGTANCLAPLLRGMAHGSRIAIVSSSVTFLPLTRAEAYGA
ncbi:MAG TPA: short-chain dehydrogenase, partial [Gammaproteobacteria bacterium]|nr:short-chain dehydrogenase [Gammaproteobacteria bacterium]